MSDTDHSHPSSPESQPGEPPAPSWHPESVGPYRILQALGQGGMGTVYEAEQTSPVHRRVALKVVRAGLESQDVAARFESERQALAVMNHEAIAKVLDAGTGENGLPYFVMELVRGVPITEYCDSRKLSIRDRVSLFITVCQGVQHAHQKGVIHRDLKPSNVLVTEVDGAPVPKIIDFGIAKATGQRLTDATVVTLVGQTMGTPAYMSPEQAEMSGLDVDTRTDVFSLGVMLYELLVGRLPEDPAAVGIPAFLMRLSMRETDPPTPSSKLTTLAQAGDVLASLRRTSTDGMRRTLKGDLDAIVMTAMEKDRNRRYSAASALAEDLANYLTDQPVGARAPSASYRMRKFVKRHRVGAVATAAVLLAVVIGAAAAATGFVRATRANAVAVQEAATARQVSDFLVRLFDVSSPGQARGNTLTAREILDSGAVRLQVELTDQPAVQARLLNTIGDVYHNLGLFEESERLLNQALATRETLDGDQNRGISYNLTSLGRLYKDQGLYDKADSTLMRASRVAAQLADPYPGYTIVLSQQVELYRQIGRYDEADSTGRMVLAILEAQEEPDLREMDSQLGELAIIQAERGMPAAAESLFRRVLHVREQNAGPDASSTAFALSNLASSLYELGRLQEAESLYTRAYQIKARIYTPDHPEVALELYNIGNIHAALGRHNEGIESYGEAQAIWEDSFGPSHPYVAAALTSMANSYSALNRHADAVPLLRRAIEIRESSLAPDHSYIATSYHVLGTTELQLRRFEDAEISLLKALDIRERSLDPTSYYTGESLESLAGLYRDTGRNEQAVIYYERALTLWESVDRADRAERVSRTARAYAAVLRQLGRETDAIAVEQRGANGG